MFVQVCGFALQEAVHILENVPVELRYDYRITGDVNQSLGRGEPAVNVKYFHPIMIHIKSRRVFILHKVLSVRNILMCNERFFIDKVIERQSGEDVVGER